MSIKTKTISYSALFSLCLSLSGFSLANDTQVITFPDGSQYKGQVENGKPDGQGHIQWANGDQYEGQWQDEQPHGYGKKTFLDGSVYEGEFFNGVQQGKGMLIYPDGTIYTGDWKSGSPDGVGSFTFKNAGTYEGAVYLGLPHGKGTFTYSNGDVYDGQWEHGKRQGMGKLRYANGELYVGNFDNGKPQGSGVLTFANGSRFKGNFDNGKPHGDGTCLSSKEQALCSYVKGKRIAYAVIPNYLNEEANKVATTATSTPATNNQVAQVTEPPQTTQVISATTVSNNKAAFVEALTQEKEKLKPVYSAADLNTRRSDILFNHNFESLELSNALRTGWWKELGSLFSDQLELHARSGDLEIKVKVRRFDGPGTYRIKPSEIKAWFKDKPLTGLKDFANTITIKKIEAGWLEGNLNLSFQQKDTYGDYYKVENGVFRLNDEPIFSPRQ